MQRVALGQRTKDGEMIYKLQSTRQTQLLLILEYRKGNVPRLKPHLNIKEKITLKMQSKTFYPRRLHLKRGKYMTHCVVLMLVPLP